MRKKLAVAVFAVIMVFSVAGCLDNEVPEQQINTDLPKDTVGKITVTILSNQSEIDMWTACKNEFSKIYPNITVDLYDVPSYEDNITGIVKDDEVDVVHVPDNMASYFAASDILESLDGYMESSEFDESLYYESMMRLGKYNYTGAQYMMPRDYSKIVTYWNRGMFDEIGMVNRPTDDWDWDDFLKVCEELKAKLPNKFLPLNSSMDYAILNYAMVASYGVTNYLDDDYLIVNTSDRLNDVYSGMSLGKDLIDEGYALKPDQYNKGEFFRKTAAMTFEVRPEFSTLATAEQKIDFEVAPFPAINGNENAKIPAGTSGFSISKTSRNKNIAWAFISFMMSEQGQRCISNVGNVVPVLKSLAENPDADWRKLKNGQGKEVNHEAFVMYPGRDICNEYFGNLPPLAMKLWKGTWNTMCKDYFNGSKDFDIAYENCVNATKTNKKNYPNYFK